MNECFSLDTYALNNILLFGIGLISIFQFMQKCCGKVSVKIEQKKKYFEAANAE